MLLKSNRLIGAPVLSLHLGGPIGRTTAEVVDPNDLKIIALMVEGPQIGNGENGNILEIKSVREFSNLGLIIDSIDDLVSQGDVIKLDKILELNFNIIGLSVKTKKGSKLGKITDYVYDSESMQIMQLIVKRPVIKSFLDPELTIPRSEIIEVNDYEIIVKDEMAKKDAPVKQKDFVPNFVNPFREGKFATNDVALEEDK